MSPMSPYRRENSPYWFVRRYIAGLGEFRLSTRTRNKALAVRYDELICGLKDGGRIDILLGLRDGKFTLAEVLASKFPGQLDALLARNTSPGLRPLVEEWLKMGADDTGLRDRSMRRYATSWRRFWEVLPQNARVADLTQGFVSEFKRHRIAASEATGRKISPATLNRDLAALGAFLTWCREEKSLAVERPRLKYMRESRGRMRWLTEQELAAFQGKCPAEWWPLFGLLFVTGITISEALGLRVADLDLESRRISIHEEYGRKLKRASRSRDLRIPDGFVPILARWLGQQPSSPVTPAFPLTYWPARKAWRATCRAAGIFGATIHDARHTFAVHAVMNGIPEARLQKLLGHAHPGTTRRYAMHSPEQFMEQDAERIAGSMGLSAEHPRTVAATENRQLRIHLGNG